MGGLTTVTWDSWLAQKVGKAKAKWESKRRRPRDEVGDAEETSIPQNAPPAQELQVQRPEAVKRRGHGDSSTDRIVTEDAPSEPGQVGGQRSIDSDVLTNPSPLADTKTHNISVKLGVSLVAAFFGE